VLRSHKFHFGHLVRKSFDAGYLAAAKRKAQYVSAAEHSLHHPRHAFPSNLLKSSRKY
jgi:hypothetical protein